MKGRKNFNRFSLSQKRKEEKNYMKENSERKIYTYSQ
jgi:hypothetical protein